MRGGGQFPAGTCIRGGAEFHLKPDPPDFIEGRRCRDGMSSFMETGLCLRLAKELPSRPRVRSRRARPVSPPVLQRWREVPPMLQRKPLHAPKIRPPLYREEFWRVLPGFSRETVGPAPTGERIWQP